MYWDLAYVARDSAFFYLAGNIQETAQSLFVVRAKVLKLK